MKLSEAIRRGAKMRGETTCFVYYNGNTDAWGAALEGAGLVDWDVPWALGLVAEWRARHLWPFLYQEAQCPSCDKRKPLAYLFDHLADGHRWGREQTARWVESEFERPELPAGQIT